VAVDEIGQILDQRLERGNSVWSDVELCRKGAALSRRDDMMKRCARLSEKFRYYISVAAPRTSRTPGEMLQKVERLLYDRHTDRVQLVGDNHPKHNAVLEFHVASPELTEEPWHLVERSSHRTWVPVRDKKGRHVTRTITIQPTPEAIAAAKKAKKPRPEPKEIEKKVWQQVEAELRRFKQSRSVHISWSAGLRDLRDQRMVSGTAARAAAHAESSYAECSGDRRACPTLAIVFGQQSAEEMPSPDQLARKAAGNLPKQVLDWILESAD
jgi:hypothetical protein